MSRTVTVYSTAGDSRGTNVASNATTWGQLQADLTSANINWSGMKAIEGASKHTFDSPDATLPEGDFRLFLMPVRTKSGGGDDHSPYQGDPASENNAEDEEEIPDNNFGKSCKDVQVLLDDHNSWLDDVDRLRLILMAQDLAELAWKMDNLSKTTEDATS